MKDLMRSQFYSLRRELKLLLPMAVLFIAGILVSAVISMGETMVFEDNAFGIDLSGSMIFTSSVNYNIYILVFVFIVTGLIASRDLSDKSVNYEIMYGHDRKNVFLSRAAAAMTAGAGGGILIFMCVPLTATAIYGWGNSISLSALLLRTLMIFLLYCRVSAEIIFLSALVKRTHIVYIIGTTAGFLELILGEETEGSRYALAANADMSILDFKMFSLSHLDDKTELFFDSRIEPFTVAAVCISYAFITVAFIYIGRRTFERSDLA